MALPKLEEESERTPARMKVSLGVMPDYAHQGKGLKIDSVIDNKPAKNSGMKDGDVVIKIQDTVIDDIYKYMEILSKIEPGSKAQATVLRNDEEVMIDVQF
jgi:S1-C subfamily serine protease